MARKDVIAEMLVVAEQLAGDSNKVGFELDPKEYHDIVAIRDFMNTIIENEMLYGGK